MLLTAANGLVQGLGWPAVAKMIRAWYVLLKELSSLCKDSLVINCLPFMGRLYNPVGRGGESEFGNIAGIFFLSYQ